MKFTVRFAILGLAFLLIGQKTFSQFMIKVTSHSSSNEIIGESYLLAPGETVKHVQNTLANKNHCSLIEKILASKKFFRIIDTVNQKPSLIIEYDYYVSSPESFTETRYLPTYTPSNNVNANVTVNALINSPVISSNNQRVLPQPVIANSSNNNSSIFNNPSGYTKVETAKTVYGRTLVLRCYSLNNGAKEELWITEAESTGPTGDINELVPALIFAIKGYVGKNLYSSKIEKVSTSSSGYNRFIKN